MKPNNKYLPYGRQWICGRDIQKVVSVLRSDFITQGQTIKEFEDETARRCGAKFAVAVSSGTAALHISCLAAGIKPSDEVISTPITFVASLNCVLYCGGRPVFADVQEDTINVSPQEIKDKINKKTRAIIPVHFAGHPCDLTEIYDIAKKHNLIVIEDAAHALGAEYRGYKIGSCRYSDMTVLSFHPVKHITTGEGGMVLTNDKGLYKKLMIFRNHGITKNPEDLYKKNQGAWYYEMQTIGFNYRITDFQCALGISQLSRLEKFVEKRRNLAAIYERELSEAEGIMLPYERDYVKSSWHIYVVRVKNRKKIFEKLRKARIGVNVHYRPVYLQPFYEKLGYKQGLCPKAERYYEDTLTLPLYPKMKKEDVGYIANKLLSCV